MCAAEQLDSAEASARTAVAKAVEEAVIFRALADREEGFAVSVTDTVRAMDAAAHNMCVDYDMNSYREELNDPEIQMDWLDTALDTAQQCIGYAACLMNALGITEEELRAFMRSDYEYPFLPESLNRDVKITVLERHRKSAEDSEKMYRSYISRNPKNAESWKKYADEQKERAEKLSCRIKELQDGS